MQASSDKKFEFMPKSVEEWPEEDRASLIAKMDAELSAGHCAIDYSEATAFDNVAVYTPALSDSWINTVERIGNDPSAHTLPKFADFQLEAADLQFTNPHSRLCFYPWVLYSAGQAVNPDSKAGAPAWKDNWLTRKPRDPRVVVLGDSGGFQIQEGTMSFHGEPTVRLILKWLEAVADQSMVMDFPTGKISLGNLIDHTKRLVDQGVPIETMARNKGLDSGFVTCLHQTIQNNDVYVEARVPGATNLLNIIQGRNELESWEWYEQVKHYPFEGWAFAGRHHSDISLTLRRLIQMRNDGLLEKASWMHFLGVSTLKIAGILTYIQRALRKHTDAKTIQLSFDSKSPIDAVIHGYQVVVGADFDRGDWRFRTEKLDLKACLNDQRLLGEIGLEWSRKSLDRFLVKTALGQRLQLKDMVEQNPVTGAVKPNPIQQALLIHHNTQAYFECFRHMYVLLDDHTLHRRSPELNAVKTIIEGLFTEEQPFKFIDGAQKDLEHFVLGVR